ncbi:MAG: DUF721 domain-containing protein [Desulfobacterales bacterium]|jgi:predicted nucleic acid-binding Zn ribbon protein|nr:DUF721 domain-containing protein [Desulfobacteraceae bacterium]MDD3992931.1 DUF721 domain-containing protein [Desulfobacteraceae bacterium]MDY0313180.1 DUF721 domain-containing protein [Desulfobacterales bacterium]NCC94688.1 DUF721 domain-containing protein [Opitutae bacterium]
MDRPSSQNSAPVHIGRLLEDALARLCPSGDKALLDICRRWEALVGAAIAANARPVGLKDHLLLVDVASSVWMQQLQFLKAEMITRINAGLPEAGIEKIRFRVSR